jgi:hypothetical protein
MIFNSVPQWLFERFTLSFFLLHMVAVDLKMWNEAKRVPAWIVSDAVYLSGTAIDYILVCICFHFSWNQIFYLGLFGSVAWDWIYGWYQDHDVFFPFQNWYGGWGFATKADRILFDADRLLGAIFFILC